MTYDVYLGLIVPAIGLYCWWLFGRLGARLRWAPANERALAREQERLDRNDRRVAWRALFGLAALAGWLTLAIGLLNETP